MTLIPHCTTSLPDLPLVVLKTAESTSTVHAVRGKNTIIDFWTTRCTRCPAALDKLDRMARDPTYQNVQFLSICCDQLDGAREIIEKDDDLRWSHVRHYYMEPHDKEVAKSVLGFASVPFYVVLNDKGEIIQKGNSKAVDLENVPGMVRTPELEKENVGMRMSEIIKGTATKIDEQPAAQTVERSFIIKDDF